MGQSFLHIGSKYWNSFIIKRQYFPQLQHIMWIALKVRRIGIEIRSTTIYTCTSVYLLPYGKIIFIFLSFINTTHYTCNWILEHYTM